MSNEKVTVHIVGLLEQPDYEGVAKSGPNKGNPYVIKSWVCSGTVNGEEKKGINLKVMGSDPEAIKAVKEGATLDCWPDVYNGQLKGYKYATPKQGGGARVGGRSFVKYTREEYEALFMHATMFITTKVAPSMNIEADNYDVIVPMVSTYIIGAQNSGIKVGPAKENA